MPTLSEANSQLVAPASSSPGPGLGSPNQGSAGESSELRLRRPSLNPCPGNHKRDHQVPTSPGCRGPKVTALAAASRPRGHAAPSLQAPISPVDNGDKSYYLPHGFPRAASQSTPLGGWRRRANCLACPGGKAGCWRASHPGCRLLTSPCILTWERRHLALWPLLIRTLIPLMRAPPSRPKHLPKDSAPHTPSRYGLGFNI